MSKTKYTKDMLESIVKISYTYADVCRSLGLHPSSGSQSHISKKIRDYSIDVSHFVGKNWSITKNMIKLAKPIEYYLVKGSSIKSQHLLKKLIKCGMKSRICERCKSETWTDKPIPLELHHKDCDHSNNELSNLEILCPNCHALYHSASKKKPENSHVHKEPKPIYCPKCGRKILKGSKVCSICYNEYRKEFTLSTKRKTKINWPHIEQILKELETKSCLQLSKELGVSNNAIKKHIKHYHS